jgi:cytochrome P450
MSTTLTPGVLRPAPGGLKGRVMAAMMPWVMETALPLGFRLLRALRRIPRFGKHLVVTRYDEVREVFLNDRSFRVPYTEKLNVIMGGHPFFLGMDDTEEYRSDTEAMRKVIRVTDIPERLIPEVERLGEKVVTGANGRLEVVDALVRQITFDLYRGYFGIPDPPGGDLRVLATRLFEFQFVDVGNDPALRAEVDVMAPALRNHIQGLMDARRASGQVADDVLGRCLAMQAQQVPGFDDGHIRSSLMGLIVGGPPQPPMVVPQAMEQLLRRPDALAGAQQAARANDDKLLAGYVFEAMRFDPLAPFMPRVATRASTIAVGTPRAVAVPEGAKILVAFSSAMMDERRLPEPQTFNPRRLPHEYIHFGYGLHQCFGIHMNMALLPLMLKALLKRPNLRRAPGPEGRLRKRGAFADRLEVNYD